MSSSTAKPTAAVVTISDSCSRGEREDLSGPAVRDRLSRQGFEITSWAVVSDEQAAIQQTLTRLASQAQLVVTTGGTGIAERDVTPEATKAVCSRLIEGISDWMRIKGMEKTSRSLLSRGVCGVCGKSLVLNLPGSPRGAVESLEAVIEVIPHALELLAGRTAHS